MRRVNRVPGITKVEERSLTVLQSRLKVPGTRPELRAAEGSRRAAVKTHAPGAGEEDHSMPPGCKKNQTILMGQGTDRGQPDSGPLLLPKQFRGVGWGSIPSATPDKPFTPYRCWLMDPLQLSPPSLQTTVTLALKTILGFALLGGRPPFSPSPGHCPPGFYSPG